MKGKPKGSQKTGGRVAGVKNKKTVEQLARAERILQLIENDYFENDIKLISPGQRMDLYQNMLEYTAPKLSRVEQTGETKTELTIKILRGSKS